MNKQLTRGNDLINQTEGTSKTFERDAILVVFDINF